MPRLGMWSCSCAEWGGGVGWSSSPISVPVGWDAWGSVWQPGGIPYRPVVGGEGRVIEAERNCWMWVGYGAEVPLWGEPRDARGLQRCSLGRSLRSLSAPGRTPSGRPALQPPLCAAEPPPGGARRARSSGSARCVRGEGRRGKEEGAGKGGAGLSPARHSAPCPQHRPPAAPSPRRGSGRARPFPRMRISFLPLSAALGLARSRGALAVQDASPSPPRPPAHGSARTPPLIPPPGRDPRSRPTGGGWGRGPGWGRPPAALCSEPRPPKPRFGLPTTADHRRDVRTPTGGSAAPRPRYPCGSGAVGRVPSAVPAAGKGRTRGALLLSSESRDAASCGVFPATSLGRSRVGIPPRAAPALLPRGRCQPGVGLRPLRPGDPRVGAPSAAP